MLTGLLPPEHGVRENGLFHLTKDHPTIAVLLPPETGRGAFVGAFPLASRFGLNAGFDPYDDAFPAGDDRGRFPERRASEVFLAASAWLRSTTAERPFAWIHVYDPHYPYAPPNPWPRLSARQSMADDYETEISYIDHELGRFLREIGASERSRSATIFLTADHGEALGAHKELTHSLFVYDETQRVPMILVGPSTSPSLETRQRTLCDVAPTILAEYRVASPKGWRGTPLTDAPRESEAYVETMSTELLKGWSSLYGVRTTRWKYIRAPRSELYDLELDPAESENQIEKQPQVAARLAEATEAVLASAPSAQTPEVHDDAVEQLRSLGYVATIEPGSAKTPKRDPKDGIDGAVALFRGEEAYLAADFRRAEPLLRLALELDPKSKEAHSFLAGTYYGLDRYAESAEHARRALALPPHLNEGPLHMTMGEALLGLGRRDEAILSLQEAVRRMPKNAKARALLESAESRAG